MYACADVPGARPAGGGAAVPGGVGEWAPAAVAAAERARGERARHAVGT